MDVRPDRCGEFAMVASTHWRATRAALDILDAGGNAFDAAVAGAFVLHLVEPHLNGPGGDLPAVFATAADPRPRVLCGQGPLPAAATRETFDGLRLDLVPGSGPLAAVVPGAVDAWLLLLRDHGTMALADVLAAAVGLARDGHPLLPAAAQTVTRMAPHFIEHWPTSAALWLPGGRSPRPWAPHRNPAWAEVLSRLIAAGSHAAGREAAIDAARIQWREGFVADAMIASVARPQRDSSGADHAGLLTAADLAGWQAFYETPSLGSFRGFQIAKTGPWGQGPVLLQTLAVLDGFSDAELDLREPAAVHRTVEAMKLAMADREAYYGDGADPVLATLLSPEYTAERRARIGPDASTELRPGRPDGRQPRLPTLLAHPVATAPELGEPTVGRCGATRGDTCHIDVVDRHGNIISATPSGGWLQSAPVIAALGFPLGSRAQMSWVEPGLASSLPTAAEVARHGPQRPRTTLSPTLVLRDGVPVLACGTPGGDQQDQWQLLFLLRRLAGAGSDMASGSDAGAPVGLQEAIDAPAWHTTSFPSSFYPREMEPGGLVVEPRVGARALAELRARGHRVTESGPWALGRLCAVAREPGPSARLSAAATARGGSAHATGR